MAIDLLQLIKANKVFASLDDAALKKIFSKSRKKYLKKNEILFRQGEASTNIYFLVAGKIVVTLKTENHEQTVLNEINPGETVGELSALSREPRSATATAVMDSILLLLPSETFREVFQEYPDVLFETIDIFVNRSRAAIEQLTEMSNKKRIAILPANATISLKNFSEKLAEHIRNLPDVVLLSEFDVELQSNNNLEAQHTTTIYILESHETALSKACFAKPVSVYIVADTNAQPDITHFVLDKIKDKAELIFWHQKTNYPPKNASLWLKQTHFALYHHVRIHQDKDYQRLLRFMTGRAVGVVLGGGGLRCWAQLGAINALLEANIPIDMIGGTSAGAIVAGFYALHESLEDPHKQLEALSEATRKTVSLRNLTWPAISLFNGKAYTRVQKNMFGITRIENLTLPTFFVSCNLANNTETVHQSGYLWKAIRSSTAVPAIFPPVVMKGQIHLDGGILNNLPVDVMKKFIGNQGTTIAIELTHNGHNHNDYRFPSVLPFWQTMLTKLGFIHKKYKFPRFVDTFLNALLAGSSAKQFENSLAADVLICPDLSQYGLLNVSKKQEQELIKLGYDAAVAAIKKWHKKTL